MALLIHPVPLIIRRCRLHFSKRQLPSYGREANTNGSASEALLTYFQGGFGQLHALSL